MELFKECKECGRQSDDDELKKGLCPKCRGLFQCGNCNEWVKKVNKKGVCEFCIPHYKKLESVSDMVDRYNYGGEGQLERLSGKIDSLISVVESLVSILPKEKKEGLFTIECERNDSGAFIKEEDKID